MLLILLPPNARQLRRTFEVESSIDELGRLQQDREEIEVLFNLLAEGYERGSILLTSNLAFRKGDQIFKDAMTSAAAIDRLVRQASSSN